MHRTINAKGETIWVDDNGAPVPPPTGGPRSVPRPPASGAEPVRPAAPVAARQGAAPRQTAPPGMQLVHTPDGLRARDLSTLATMRLEHVPAFETARESGTLGDVAGKPWEPGQAAEALPPAPASPAPEDAAPAVTPDSPAAPTWTGVSAEAVAALVAEQLAPLLGRLAALEEQLAPLLGRLAALEEQLVARGRARRGADPKPAAAPGEGTPPEAPPA